MTITKNRYEYVDQNGDPQTGSGGLIIIGNMPGLSINNSIIAGNFVAEGDSPDIRGTAASGGYNLIGVTGGANNNGFSTANNDIFNQPANLGALSNNGGQTDTNMPMTGSPAIDKGNSLFTTDQRGFNRPFDNPSITNATGGNGADIGAFEVQTAPTAATVSVSGRVQTPEGKGLTNARVILTDSRGDTRIALTSAFGFYRFTDIAAGETYIISVSSKRYSFAPQVINVNDGISGLDFTPQQKQTRRNCRHRARCRLFINEYVNFN